MTSRLLLCFSSRPREAGKSDGVMPCLTLGQPHWLMMPWCQPISGDHEGTHLENWWIFYSDPPLRPQIKALRMEDPLWLSREPTCAFPHCLLSPGHTYTLSPSFPSSLLPPLPPWSLPKTFLPLSSLQAMYLSVCILGLTFSTSVTF